MLEEDALTAAPGVASKYICTALAVNDDDTM